MKKPIKYDKTGIAIHSAFVMLGIIMTASAAANNSWGWFLFSGFILFLQVLGLQALLTPDLDDQDA